MPFLKRNNLIIKFFICCLLLSSCNQNLSSRKKQEYKTLPEIQESAPREPSLSEQFTEARKETEFLDDRTETMLNRNKKWFLLGIVCFILLAFQSMRNYHKNKSNKS